MSTAGVTRTEKERTPQWIVHRRIDRRASAVRDHQGSAPQAAAATSDLAVTNHSARRQLAGASGTSPPSHHPAGQRPRDRAGRCRAKTPARSVLPGHRPSVRVGVIEALARRTRNPRAGAVDAVSDLGRAGTHHLPHLLRPHRLPVNPPREAGRDAR
ncbi:hypothetical protein [Williamsia sp. 1135]|uniref:hypothetical protein n=1 Tax=Williamsia sp. 1135 TaxID=1889262 RepID=UPI00117FD0D8|nr:hypothetical protein [Williamsia sp. 1135]